MPKKFKGENTKAVTAKERKAAAKRELDGEKKRREEDAYWQDDDKHLAKKQERKADRDRKKQEQLERKQMSKQLLADEEAKQVGKQSASSSKVTRAQISEMEAERKTERDRAEASALPKGVTTGVGLELNPNLLLIQRLESGELEARTVDEALDILGGATSRGQPDMHPEKRQKAAYTTFEERELPRLKAENGHLRMSQIKQLLRKEWMKSPENPVNS